MKQVEDGDLWFRGHRVQRDPPARYFIQPSEISVTMRPWPEYLGVLTSLFAMCTAPAIVPTFLGMTSEMDSKGRIRTALTAAFTTFVALVVVVFAGEPLFSLFGIDIASFRVAGGLLIMISGIEMARGTANKQPEKTGAPEKNPAVMPLGIPIITGPGLITAMLVQANEHSGLIDDLILIAAAATLAIYVLVCFLLGERLITFMGEAGLNILERFMGLFLMAIAAEFILTGIVDSLPVLSGKF